MPIDPHFDQHRQQIAPGLKVTVMWEKEDYEQGVQKIATAALDYFIDDVAFGFGTPSGPDAIFRVKARRITKEGKITPGSITLESANDNVEWQSDLAYSQWRYICYDALLDTLHGPQGSQPLAQAKDLLAKVMSRKEPPEPEPERQVVKIGFDSQLTSRISSLDGSFPSLLHISQPSGLVLSPHMSQALSHLRETVAKISQYQSEHPDATPEMLREWMHRENIGPVSEFNLTTDSLPPNLTRQETDLPTIFDLLPEYEPDGDMSPTELVDGEKPMTFAVSSEFESDEQKLAEMNIDELLALLTLEIAGFPLQGMDSEIRWVTHRHAESNYGIVGSSGNVEADEVVAISVPAEGANYQYYWSSYSDCVWVRQVPSN